MPVVDSFNFKRTMSIEDLALALEGNMPPNHGKTIILRRNPDGYRITVENSASEGIYPIYTSNDANSKGSIYQNSTDNNIFEKIHGRLSHNLGNQERNITIEEE